MSFLEAVIARSKTIESLLEGKYNGAGRGLHEKLSSVEDRLDPSITKRIRYVATVRNKLVHESNYRFEGSADEFLRKCDEIIRYLHSAQPVSRSRYTAPYHAPRSNKAGIRTPFLLISILGIVVIFMFIMFKTSPHIRSANIFDNKAQNVKTRTAESQKVRVAPIVLDSYTGRYNYGGRNAEVSKSGADNDELFISSSEIGGGLIPISETEFLPKSADTTSVKSVKFVKDSRGKVTHMMVTKEDGQQVRAKKIK